MNFAQESGFFEKKSELSWLHWHSRCNKGGTSVAPDFIPSNLVFDELIINVYLFFNAFQIF